MRSATNPLALPRPRKPRADKGQPRGPYKPARPSRSVRLDPDVQAMMEEYFSDVEGYSKNETINEALRAYFAMEKLPEGQWHKVQAILFPNRYRARKSGA